ncbi:TPA: hypothetical protein VCS55_001604 [Streptococcus pyogenes]|uniref:Uncharacterized protein n=3 Tax=Streptococcus pyogenes TaxID=1314 RepID=A0A5S4TJK5_STRPY|nr:hypothetical protein SpyM3_1258 [Streptococcus phage 315.4]AAM79865.1 hypothetical protein - phage-associated [Streptococcus pyogenes MGAS315]AAX72388.1 phage protein [Streptococcus pyogenes phage 6180.2] [Streptococcus pyogenes MGAS6180]ABF34419.1 phage protein [Streptococcus pyogenes MGAS10270]ASQ21775.1 hypothetical protein B4W66_07800 [Streptococcus pyogenes]WDT94991.1 hypothetical protein C9Q_06325 [Streptococcus pyogenes MGAS10870]BAC63700.1 conserved hypothetical protein [Streptococ
MTLHNFSSFRNDSFIIARRRNYTDRKENHMRPKRYPYSGKKNRKAKDISLKLMSKEELSDFSRQIAEATRDSVEPFREPQSMMS